jgi:hypothetical protein
VLGTTLLDDDSGHSLGSITEDSESTFGDLLGLQLLLIQMMIRLLLDQTVVLRQASHRLIKKLAPQINPSDRHQFRAMLEQASLYQKKASPTCYKI